MDFRAAAFAIVLGVPPGAGMGLALVSVTRGDALVPGIVVGIIASLVLSAAIYLLGTRGRVEDPAADHSS